MGPSALWPGKQAEAGSGLVPWGGSVLSTHPYLGEVLGDAAPAVGIGDLRVLQVHSPLAHVLVEQDGPVVTPCRGGQACEEGSGSEGAKARLLELEPQQPLRAS